MPPAASSPGLPSADLRALDQSAAGAVRGPAGSPPAPRLRRPPGRSAGSTRAVDEALTRAHRPGRRPPRHRRGWFRRRAGPTRADCHADVRPRYRPYPFLRGRDMYDALRGGRSCRGTCRVLDDGRRRPPSGFHLSLSRIPTPQATRPANAPGWSRRRGAGWSLPGRGVRRAGPSRRRRPILGDPLAATLEMAAASRGPGEAGRGRRRRRAGPGARGTQAFSPGRTRSSGSAVKAWARRKDRRGDRPRQGPRDPPPADR